MLDLDNYATYNLKVVMTETGLSADTLRVWERRYGIPQPIRSKGGQRLYCKNDILMLQWLVTHVESGMSISAAVNLLRALQSQGKLNFQVAYQQHDPFAELSRVWRAACLQFNAQQAEHIFQQAALSFSPERACLGILLPSIAQIGEEWFAGKVSVQQERFCTSLAIALTQSAIAKLPAPVLAQRVLLICPPNEHHSFGMILLHLLLRARGLDVVYWGESVPLENLQESLAVVKPDVVLLNAQRLASVPHLVSAVRVIRQAGIYVGYGGGVFRRHPQLIEIVPAAYQDGDLAMVSQRLIQSFLQQENLPPMLEVASLQPHPFYYQFRAMQSAIAENAHAGLHSEQTGEFWQQTCKHLNESILAACALNNLPLLEDEVSWICQLSQARLSESQSCHSFLSAYTQALSDHLGEQATPVTQVLQNAMLQAHC